MRKSEKLLVKIKKIGLDYIQYGQRDTETPCYYVYLFTFDNDGSLIQCFNDQKLNVCFKQARGWVDKCLRYQRKCAKLGLVFSVTYRTGIHSVEGEFLARVDVDDKNSFKRAVKELRKEGEI